MKLRWQFSKPQTVPGRTFLFQFSHIPLTAEKPRAVTATSKLLFPAIEAGVFCSYLGLSEESGIKKLAFRNLP